MGRDIVVILNPVAGRGAGGALAKRIREGLRVAFPRAEFVETTVGGAAVATGEFAPGSGAWHAAKAVAFGAKMVVAAGGDGTVGEVANGLVGTSATLGIIPVGTGNDLARHLGIPTDLKTAVEVLASGTSRAIDVGKSPRGYFLNVAGCGFDAEVAAAINHRMKWLKGTTAYVAAVIATLSQYRPQQIRLVVDGEVHEETVMLCAIANAQFYGGGMKIAPLADVTDGQLDVVLVGDVSRAEFLKTFPIVFSGDHLKHPKVKHYRGSVVQVSSSRPMPMLADGEEIGNTPGEFRVIPNGLKVMTPSVAASGA